MKISECNQGRIVQTTGGFDHVPRYGHIVGLTHNMQETPEVIVVVQWAADPNKGPRMPQIGPERFNYEVSSIHPCRLEPVA